MPSEAKPIEGQGYRRAEHVAWRQIGDETIVLDLTAKEMFGLNVAGGLLWRALDAGALRRDDLDPDELEFVDQLKELGMIVMCDVETRAAEIEERPPRDRPRSGKEKPALVWREAVEQAAATCAFLPGQNILCNSAPFS